MFYLQVASVNLMHCSFMKFIFSIIISKFPLSLYICMLDIKFVVVLVFKMELEVLECTQRFSYRWNCMEINNPCAGIVVYSYFVIFSLFHILVSYVSVGFRIQPTSTCLEQVVVVFAHITKHISTHLFLSLHSKSIFLNNMDVCGTATIFMKVNFAAVAHSSVSGLTRGSDSMKSSVI